MAHISTQKGGLLKEVFFSIKTTPVAKLRPKLTTINGYARAYTPKKTKDFENLVAEHYAVKAKGVFFDRETPVQVSLYFGMPIPKTTTKSRRRAMLDGVLKPIKKPDCDNLAKAVLDGLNGVAWADDAQITRLYMRKEYTDEPHISVYIHEIQD